MQERDRANTTRLPINYYQGVIIEKRKWNNLRVRGETKAE